jgi:hypothetical protein
MGKRSVSILVVLALIAPASSATAGPKSPNLAKCNGKERRPANPYGSILPTVDPAAGTSTSANLPQTQGTAEGRQRNGVDVFPGKTPPPPNPATPDAKPDRQVPPISNATPSTAYGSC